MGTDGGLNVMGKNINNKGVVVIYVAIGIIVLIAFVGLAVDIGYMYVAKGQLQNAADAAALAGAVKINPFIPIQQQYSARGTAQAFAAKNKSAGSPVAITSNANKNSMDVDNDITFGHWTQVAGYQEGGTPLNAIRVRARRTVPGATPANQGQIAIFFGKVIGWPVMSAAAESYAVSELATPGMVICVNTCSSNSIPNLISSCSPLPAGGPPGAAFLQLSPTSGPSTMCYTAWTAFTTTNNISLGPNGNVVQIINGTAGPVNLCNIPCFTTTQGLGEAWNVFEEAYNAHKDPVTGRWTIGVPIVDNSQVNPSCPSQGATVCPPSNAGNPSETYNPVGFATIRIVGLKTGGPGGERGIWIDQINCITCDPSLPVQGNTAKLVDPRPNP